MPRVASWAGMAGRTTPIWLISRPRPMDRLILNAVLPPCSTRFPPTIASRFCMHVIEGEDPGYSGSRVWLSCATAKRRITRRNR